MRSVLPLLAALAAASCASKALVLRQDDETFAMAQKHLVRVERDLEAAPATPEDRELFMEAEAFYHYRFRFPSRGFWGYIAEGTAAVTDFPAFQSLAGSLDLADLRLSAYDGAVHLWETLLAQSPETPLKPLALYRLGWAYRNTSVRGFPRASGDEAFDALVKDQPGTPLAALAAEARRTPWKSRATATAYSLVPGLAQMYAGEYKNGAVRLAIALVCAAAVAVPVVLAAERGRDLAWGQDWPLLVAGTAGIIGLSIDYTAAYQDGQRAVVEFNENAEVAFVRAHPDAP